MTEEGAEHVRRKLVIEIPRLWRAKRTSAVLSCRWSSGNEAISALIESRCLRASESHGVGALRVSRSRR
jgi:hypothetical protein